ncbi:hypothetical protein V8F33_010154 [Rhypophila sp. PSN 637]
MGGLGLSPHMPACTPLSVQVCLPARDPVAHSSSAPRLRLRLTVPCFAHRPIAGLAGLELGNTALFYRASQKTRASNAGQVPEKSQLLQSFPIPVPFCANVCTALKPTSSLETGRPSRSGARPGDHSATQRPHIDPPIDQNNDTVARTPPGAVAAVRHRQAHQFYTRRTQSEPPAPTHPSIPPYIMRHKIARSSPPLSNSSIVLLDSDDRRLTLSRQLATNL